MFGACFLWLTHGNAVSELGVQTAGGQSFGGMPFICWNMHERKKVIFMNADAIMAPPEGAAHWMC